MVEATQKIKKPKKAQHTAIAKTKLGGAAAPMNSKFPYTFKPETKRAEALALPVASKDPVINYLVRNAEKHFIPKKVYTKDDWLACKIEPKQTVKEYAQGSPSINWIDKNNNQLLLFMVDDTIEEEVG